MRSTFRSLAVTLALSAMVLRAFLPQGWMPNPVGLGGAPLVICSADGSHRAPPVQDPAHGPQDEHNFACPFAAVAHLAPLQSPPALLEFFATAAFVPRFAEPHASFGIHDPGHAPRGPPASV